MKLKNILPVIALGALLFQACDDNKMEWYNPHEGNGVASSELPWHWPNRFPAMM